MKKFSWQIILGSSLILLSIILYLVHYAVFRDPHHIFIYMLGDIAFVPIEVLLVSLIVHRLLSEREKRTRLKKINMVIGTFFSEMGTELLKSFSLLDPRCHNLRKFLYEHLAGDIKRVYSLLIHEWVDYMKHLKDKYPYLFSLAMRTNPFDREASVMVR